MNTKADISVSRFRRHCAASALCAALCACVAQPPAPPLDAEPTGSVAGNDAVLALLQRFVSAGPDAQAALYAEATDAAAADPTPVNQLRVALLQGWPGHRHSHPTDSAALLEALVDDPTLDDASRDLATVVQVWIAQRGTDQRLQRSLQARIAALEHELAATRAQLDALAEIERLTNPAPCNPEVRDDCPQNGADPARR